LRRARSHCAESLTGNMRAIGAVVALAFLMTGHTHLANMIRDPKASCRESRLGLPLALPRASSLRLRGGAFWFDAYASPADKVALCLHAMPFTYFYLNIPCALTSHVRAPVC
jgi:hypothetical protein